MYSYFLTKKSALKHQAELASFGVEAEVVRKPGKWAVYHSSEQPVDILADRDWHETAKTEQDDSEQIKDNYLAELREANEA